MSFVFSADWEPHEAVWLAWPPEDWVVNGESVRDAHCRVGRVVCALLPRVRVVLLVNNRHNRRSRDNRREGTSFGGEGWLSLGWLGSGRSLVAKRGGRRWDNLSGGRGWGLWQRSPGLRLRRPQERPVLELRVLVGVELGRQFCDCGKGRARAPSGASKLRLLPHRQGRKNAGGSSHWRSLTVPQSPPVACMLLVSFWLGRDRHRPCVWAGEEPHRRHLLR